MKVIITGCNGFIGRNICSLLSEQSDIEIYGIDMGESSTAKVKYYFKTDISNENLIRDISDAVEYCDVLIHTAALISMAPFDDSLINNNIIGTNHAILLAIQTKCKKLIYLSSVPVIGKPLLLPITEEHPVYPQTLYHITKYTGEQMIRLAEQNGLLSITLRIPSPVGTGMNPDTIIPVFIKNCLQNIDIVLKGQGGRKQNYIDVRDIAKAILLCIRFQISGCYNIAGIKCFSNLELANLIKEITKSSSKIRFSGQMDPDEDFCWDISIEKANKDFTFYPEFTLDETIQQMIFDNKGYI